MTRSKGKKCTSVYLFESKEYSIGKKLFGLDWKKAIYRPLFALGNTLLVAMIFTFMKVDSLHFSKKKSLKVNWENAFLVLFGKALYRLANTLLFKVNGKAQLTFNENVQ